MTHTIKVCSACRKTLPLEEFWRHVRSKDGLQCYCKKCKVIRERTRLTNDLGAKERQRLTSIQWRKERPDYRKEYGKEYSANNPEKVRARNAVTNLIQAGKMPRAKDCKCACGESAVEYHHHRGYAWEHRYDVIPLCLACHSRTRAKYHR